MSKWEKKLENMPTAGALAAIRELQRVARKRNRVELQWSIRLKSSGTVIQMSGKFKNKH